MRRIVRPSRRRNPLYSETDLARALAGDKNLAGANLEDSSLEGANLEGANLEGAILRGAGIRYAKVRNAKLRRATLEYANLEGAYLENANLESADLSDAKLEGANLVGANLVGANLVGANLEDASLRGADLRMANLRSAKLGGADFRGADLTAASLESAKGLLTVERDERTKWPASERPAPLGEHLTFSDPSGSEAFRRWFGKSVVKDETGRPVVVYHGTKRGGFTAFDPAKADAHHPGFYFTDDFKTANTYVGKAYGPILEPTEDTSTGIYRLYVKMENPFVYDAKGRQWDALNVPDFPDARGVTYEVAHAAKKAGYDGVIFKNIRDSGGQTGYDEPADVYVVFDPRNIKSATMNVGTYDPNDPDIRHNPRRRAPARRRKR